MKTHLLTDVMSWLLVAFMLFLGLRGFIAPESAAVGFGFPLADPADGFYLHVKADRDLSIGLALAALVVLRQRRALAAVLATCLVMPLIDGTLVVLGGRHSLMYALCVHGSAAIFVATLLALLVRENSTADRATGGARSRSDRAAETG
ncbi:MAG TPA: DUF4267 domain-containing protein [Polyangiaceae bacterium]|jgi:hypothetical protein|nr:DUF4267 domain-containing protein [Polyangiaceae bacterium]